MLPIYDQKSRIKLLIVVLALVIGAVTVVYTNLLVSKLSEREQQQIDLYAKALRFTINTESDDTNVQFVSTEIIQANKTVPVILADGDGNIIDARNLDLPKGLSEAQRTELLQREIEHMRELHPPIVIELVGVRNFVYYKDSVILSQLRTYPLVQLAVIASLGIIAYFAFSYSRRAEQNRVWVGLAKETAHQLGTPLSSLMAWQSYLRDSERFRDEPIVEELGKDIRRLEIITERFSNIGSIPILKDEDIYEVAERAIDYLKVRVSRKVTFKVETLLAPGTTAKLNVPLLEWVIENICKNAVDAMDGRGSITVVIRHGGRQNKQIALDITDTGKGIPKSKVETVFQPGYTTKKRGWGLGLALAKRIIENYHAGRLYVRWSEVGKGTTFRVLLNA
ncbi:HAMP domain-containing histidine kinase [Hymenobacter busanensis]|uniref:histidine kinase n=1 Tax=Hymenobacter busanensis TaxID=2607656 RepID=A0A7L4ZZU3_9BACT|nr:HAMP domain-containing sensor histidine kinase [Hymenobacter busanensis]KAA9331302.1 HAMP domain-containing histidine kinase [Hymenobacter busanensis]QHJ08453.1 histidine kinase [Hymenobacter busanensis]